VIGLRIPANAKFLIMKAALLSIGLLLLSNSFMTLAWYGHLKFFSKNAAHSPALFIVILFSWGLAFFEYCFQVPANRIGFTENGGPFNLVQLKVIQEAITLFVFVLFSLIFYKNLRFGWNQLVGFGFLIGAVYFIFRK
jgi:uncharacterized protein (DUF486 family)